MTQTPTLRPMRADDATAVAAVVQAAADDEYRRSGSQPPSKTPEQREQFVRGMQRFAESDSAGAWVAEHGGRIVGMAEAIRRDGFWGLSMLFVDPESQSRGVGRLLLEQALRYAEGASVRMIMTSEDPRALRRYSAVGLAIHPAVKAEGKVDMAAVPDRLPGRPGGVEDLDLVADVDVGLLGRSRAPDVAFMLDNGARLYVADAAGRRGFAVLRHGTVAMLGATDADTAAGLLWRVLADTADKTDMYCLTAGQDWAVKVALAARLKVSPGGPLFVAGLDVLPGPWIPSGWYF